MNQTNKALHGAMEDLHHIRSVLDGPAALRPLAPYFLCTGVVWLTYAVIMASITVPDTLGYLWPNVSAFVFESFGALTMVVYDYGKWVIWAFLLVQCGLWQREKTAQALTGTARRSLTTWQVFLLLYLVFVIALEVARGAATNEVQMLSEGMFYFWQTAGLLQNALPILFPALPLILMGNQLEDKALSLWGWLSLVWGVALVAISLYGLSLNGTMMETGLLLVSTFLSLLMGFLAPIGLLLTAWRLGRKGEYHET
ncbi:MAG: hypothetical protein IJO37_07945 [Ruminiclostridium sp.]|nr:hypothetical protein [Ruminiclostridium sp.]